MPAPLTRVLDDLPEGVLVSQLPTPFPVGPVNCWLIAERPITLIDPGMLIPESLSAVEDLLARGGVTLADVDQVLLTHAHPDHFGAAGWIAERSPATIVCGRPEVPRIVDAPIDRERALAVMIDLGMPAEVIATLPAGLEALREMIQAPPRDRVMALDDGDVFEAGGRRFDVLVTPGHAQGHVSLHSASILFSGDHLLPHITPNPAIEIDDESDIGRRQSLVEYLASLDRFVDLDPDAVLPGHGPAFSDVGTLVRGLRTHHATRADHILDIVGELGAPSVYDIARVMFPTLEGMGVVLGLSEVVGHLDILVAEGVVSRSDDSPQRYAAA